MNKYQIAETDQYTSKIYDVKYRKICKKIRDFIYPQLRTNPFFGANIKKLKGTFAGVYRYRIGNYRLFYIIENEKVLVIILDINDRKDAYS